MKMVAMQIYVKLHCLLEVYVSACVCTCVCLCVCIIHIILELKNTPVYIVHRNKIFSPVRSMSKTHGNIRFSWQLWPQRYVIAYMSL